MVYTVKKLAEISRVSVRTLRFYDEIGLLKPAYYGENGYRQYEEEQLLMLQQILFYRELGFELKKIQKILGKNDFDKLAALLSHKKILEKDIVRKKELIETIDKTVKHIKGEYTMSLNEMYSGFSPEQQKEYETYWKNRLGEDHPTIVECEKNMKNWTKADQEKDFKEADETYKALAKFYREGKKPDSQEVQNLVRKLYEWLKRFWTPNKESFIGLGQGYTEYEWKKWFDRYDPNNHPKLAMYLAEGMKVFAERELS